VASYSAGNSAGQVRGYAETYTFVLRDFTHKQCATYCAPANSIILLVISILTYTANASNNYPSGPVLGKWRFFCEGFGQLAPIGLH
jgi:hypothetical protein